VLSETLILCSPAVACFFQLMGNMAGISQREVMFCGWEGNYRHGKELQQLLLHL